MKFSKKLFLCLSLAASIQAAHAAIEPIKPTPSTVLPEQGLWNDSVITKTENGQTVSYNVQFLVDRASGTSNGLEFRVAAVGFRNKDNTVFYKDAAYAPSLGIKSNDVFLAVKSYADGLIYVYGLKRTTDYGYTSTVTCTLPSLSFRVTPADYINVDGTRGPDFQQLINPTRIPPISISPNTKDVTSTSNCLGIKEVTMGRYR